jgi:hypothetical protein
MKKISIIPSGYGHFKITTTYRNKDISTVTTNTLAIDRYRDTDKPDRSRGERGLTRNQAANALYNEIVRNNTEYSGRISISKLSFPAVQRILDKLR